MLSLCQCSEVLTVAGSEECLVSGTSESVITPRPGGSHVTKLTAVCVCVLPAVCPMLQISYSVTLNDSAAQRGREMSDLTYKVHLHTYIQYIQFSKFNTAMLKGLSICYS